eukprot:COSAG01_NODE_216_length_21695_cov_83.368772_4_plen_154_part_00
MTDLILLGLGSNVGDRTVFLNQALTALSEHAYISVEKIATFRETQSWGLVKQQAFLNTALSCRSLLSPQELLIACQKIEQEIGRQEKANMGPRCIDIDILFYGQQIICEDNLVLPHPLLHDREFVLEPLHEIESEFLHPLLCQTVGQLFEQLK